MNSPSLEPDSGEGLPASARLRLPLEIRVHIGADPVGALSSLFQRGARLFQGPKKQDRWLPLSFPLPKWNDRDSPNPL